MEDRLTFAVDSEAPGRTQSFVSAFADHCRLSDDERSRLAVIVEELVTNIVKYGYPDGVASGHAVLALALRGDRLELKLEDDGQPFDPTAYRAPALEAALDERSEGQMGLHIVQSLAHAMAYRRDHGVNHLTLTRLLDSDGESP